MYNLLVEVFKKKMTDEEKHSGINPPELTDIERGIQKILEKSREVQNEDIRSVDKSKAKEMRRKRLETFPETRDRVEVKMVN